MKNWRKKIQNLFSLKRDSRTTGAYDGTIMTGRQRHRLTSQHRKLPSTPSSMTSSPTIRQKTEERTPLYQQKCYKATNHKEVEMKQKSRENLIEFGSKHTLRGGNEAHFKNRNTLKQTSVTDSYYRKSNTTEKCRVTSNDTLFVPEIFISHVENDDKSGAKNKTRNVYVCGHLDNDMWHRLLVDLCREFSTRCISPSEYPECNRWLSKSDVFLFLMDDISVFEPAYKDQLRLAIMLNLNIVYVRDLGFELKTEETWHDNFESEKEKGIPNPKHTDSNSKTTNQTKLQIDPSVVGLRHTGTDQSVSNQEEMYLELVGSDIIIHQENQPESGDKLHSSMNDDKSKNKSDHLSRNTYHETLSLHDNHEPYSDGNIDINKVIESEYGTSLVYHDLYHNKCLERIKSSIKSHGPNIPIDRYQSQQSLMSDFVSFDHNSRSVSCNELSLNGTSRYLHTPALSMYSSVSNDSALGDMYQRMSPEPITKEADEDLSHGQRPLYPDDITLPGGSVDTSETIYIVSPDCGHEKLKVFHWPEDVEKEAIANSPSIDSFGFQDIDLSKQINEIDLFDGNITD